MRAALAVDLAGRAVRTCHTLACAAVILTAMLVETFLVVTVKVALLVPAATVTVAGPEATLLP
jgi:hypothetical protein